ncbi:PEP-CTERM sorting domain-containing protein [Photobacterium swingsii]|uniref:PEP-CTERM sorting domain-containing protein n=1 Tax=Photobacterium swingsii TaxID=680026 RepID=UPI003D10FE2C
MKKICLGAVLALSCNFANANIFSFDINQSFSQGSGADLPITEISLGGAGSFFVDPGFSGSYFDFRLPNAGTFSTIDTQKGGYYFLDSYAMGDIIGVSNFGSQVSTVDDWDTILVNDETAGVWGSDHNGYLGFLTDANSYGWIEYTFTRVGESSTINFLSGAYNDIANADIEAGQIPEPSSLAIFGLGMFGFAAWRRSQSKTSA